MGPWPIRVGSEDWIQSVLSGRIAPEPSPAEVDFRGSSA